MGEIAAVASLRKRITSSVPDQWVRPLRRIARFADQAIGLPLSPFRKGSIATFHVGRCGSTVLGGLLGQHPRIYWDSEVYYKQWALDGFRSSGFDSARFIRQQMWKARTRYYGFEFKILQDQHLAIIGMDLPAYTAQLIAEGVTHFIVLERRNYLKRMASQYVGSKTGIRQIERGSGPAVTPVRLDVASCGFGEMQNPKPLIDCLVEIDQAYRSLETLLAGRNVLRLTYEADILEHGPEVAYRKVCEFVGLEPVAVQVRNRRTNPFPLSEMLENFDEVAAVLRDTPFAWMLDD